MQTCRLNQQIFSPHPLAKLNKTFINIDGSNIFSSAPQIPEAGKCFRNSTRMLWFWQVFPFFFLCEIESALEENAESAFASLEVWQNVFLNMSELLMNFFPSEILLLNSEPFSSYLACSARESCIIASIVFRTLKHTRAAVLHFFRKRI